jgi:predicted 3-demethylubiquinone-9 3-methyltransferase (glyoxalase superfamily)
MIAKNTICLWFDKEAEAAALFYAATFPNSEVRALHRAPGDFPGGKQGDVLTVEFTVLGLPCLGLNGGPQFKQSEAFSFQIATAVPASTRVDMQGAAAMASDAPPSVEPLFAPESLPLEPPPEPELLAPDEASAPFDPSGAVPVT